jgi:hypothetical protein
VNVPNVVRCTLVSVQLVTTHTHDTETELEMSGWNDADLGTYYTFEKCGGGGSIATTLIARSCALYWMKPRT